MGRGERGRARDVGSCRNGRFAVGGARESQGEEGKARIRGVDYESKQLWEEEDVEGWRGVATDCR